MSNFITQVQDTEETAAKIIEDVKNEGKKMIVIAKQEAQEKSDAAYEKEVPKAKEKLDNAKEEAKKIYQKLVSEYEPKVQAVDTAFGVKKEEVIIKCVAFVTGKINL